MAAPPPSYNESMRQQGPGFAAAGAYQPAYGATNPSQPGVYLAPGATPPYPPAGGYDPGKAGAHYPPPPPQAGYPGQRMPPPAGATSYQATSTVMVQSAQQNVVLVGGCPACRTGILEDDFSCCGVLCAILFFPIGILCCLAMRQRRCTHCGAVFG